VSRIYLDNHATTRVDPVVVEAMLPWMDRFYANPGSTTHDAGREAKLLMEDAISSIASHFGASPDEVIITSGATESNNLAVFGVCLHPRQKKRKIVSLVTEHQALLGPLERLAKSGFEVVYLPVQKHPSSEAGIVDLQRIADAVDPETALVSVMLANNEIGAIQPIREIANICSRFDVPLHTDASQAVGRIPIDIENLGVNLLSFSGHKVYGPKGIGGLIVHSTSAPIRISPQIVGGGQQQNLRSGTLNSMGIIGLAKALELAAAYCERDTKLVSGLRNVMWSRLSSSVDGLLFNGPTWDEAPSHSTLDQVNQERRLAGNLSLCFPKVEGQSLMLETPSLALSSGSACTSTDSAPSHVLRAIGRSEDQSRATLRVGFGRFNTQAEVECAVDLLIRGYEKLSTFVA
jgi:cysteine desulfurase